MGLGGHSKFNPKFTSMGKIARLSYIISYGAHLVALLTDVFNANMIPGNISSHWFCGIFWASKTVA